MTDYFVITGSRYFTDPGLMLDALSDFYDEFGAATLVHGGCRGVDRLASQIWEDYGPEIEILADWRTHGVAAGPIRNRTMIREYQPVMVLAFPVGPSPGTRGCINEARKSNIPVRIYEVDA